MNELSLLYNYLLVGAILFVLGLVGFITRRNMIVMFLCAEMMLQGVSLTLIGFGRFHADWGGQMLVIFIITVAACEAGIAMALILMLAQRAGKLDAAVWQDLREEGQPAYVDSRVPEERNEDHVWPTLTTAGREPQHDLEESTHRSKV
ncbi:MAG: NADH-quinone oxidoreductase subunit NuoK [Planctomycetales bacterium]|nr:NADH-quinone oxidoreductase subunit NuoK [Planctomycetales bacterium]